MNQDGLDSITMLAFFGVVNHLHSVEVELTIP